MRMMYKLVREELFLCLKRENDSLKKTISDASRFIDAMSGNQTPEMLSELSKSGLSDNELLKKLKDLSQQLNKVGAEERQRNWAAEGLAMFTQLLREQNSDVAEWMNKILSKLISHVGANQGAVFILDETAEKKVLKMIACYAYGRTKYHKKEIMPGEGILGQVFLEGETTLLKEIPPDYIKITSGLGEARPNNLLFVPLKSSNEVVGILEIASFSEFPSYVVNFLERLGESLAASIESVKIAEKTKNLLSASQQMTETMKAQEEELRQNLEEMQSTQEEMLRKQKLIDQRNELVNLIINNLPMPVFVKDEKGKYTLVNHSQADLLGCAENEIIGKDDSYFTSKVEEQEAIKQSDQAALQSTKPIELPMQSFTTSDGKTNFFKTTKVSFLNSITGNKNIIGISLDLTDRIKLEQKTLSEKVVQQNNVIIDLAGRQRMLSQKIGFYCELVHKGKKQHAETLKNTIELHEHSLQVLRDGGWPKGMEVTVPLDASHPSLKPALDEVEEIWKPLMNAAESVLSNALHENNITEIEAEAALQFVEDNVESLLRLNNQVLLNYKQIAQSELEQVGKN